MRAYFFQERMRALCTALLELPRSQGELTVSTQAISEMIRRHLKISGLSGHMQSVYLTGIRHLAHFAPSSDGPAWQFEIATLQKFVDGAYLISPMPKTKRLLGLQRHMISRRLQVAARLAQTDLSPSERVKLAMLSYIIEVELSEVRELLTQQQRH